MSIDELIEFLCKTGRTIDVVQASAELLEDETTLKSISKLLK